jgi:hypothetical protein
VGLLKFLKGRFDIATGRACPLVSSKESVGMGDFLGGMASLLFLDARTCHLGLKLGKVTHIILLERVTESKQYGLLNMVCSERVVSLTLLFTTNTLQTQQQQQQHVICN